MAAVLWLIAGFNAGLYIQTFIISHHFDLNDWWHIGGFIGPFIVGLLVK